MQIDLNKFLPNVLIRMTDIILWIIFFAFHSLVETIIFMVMDLYKTAKENHFEEIKKGKKEPYLPKTTSKEGH